MDNPAPDHPADPREPLSDAELRRLLGFAETLADAAAAVTRPHFRAQLAVESKTGAEAFDPVTLADRAAESAIRDLILETYPDHGILGEEHGYRAPAPGDAPQMTWVLDPIDGTRSFIIGVPLWGTLIALNDGRWPVLGVADQPFTGERFIGSRLGATLVHGGATRPLRTRACAELKHAIVGCTTPEIFTAASERAAFDALARSVRLVRYGADCYAYCMLALGLVDLVVEACLKPYDIQALIPIIEAAGGVVTTWSGGDPTQGGQIIAAGDRRAHALALELLAPAASDRP